MSKTITLRLDDADYTILKAAAVSERRTISNFIGYAALSHVLEDSFVTESEMQEILQNKSLLNSLKAAKKNIKEGKFKIVK